MKYNNSKQGINALIYALIIFVIVIASHLVIVLEPLYSILSYGLFNDIFYYIFRFIFVISGSMITTTIFTKKGLITYTRKESLQIKKIIILYAMVLIPVLIISAALGWEFKPIYDLGEKFTGKILYGHLLSLLFILAKTLAMTLMLYGFQTFIDESIEFNFKHSNLIPLSGIMLLLTFGIYELALGYTTLPLLYLLFNIYFGIIFSVTEKSITKTYLLITILYFF